MKEIKEIIAAFDKARAEGKRTALATVVHVEGSSYRRPGARMLVTEDGQLTGAISGGCLEGDALRKARLVIMQQKAMLVTYDTTDDDDAMLGVGLGCNGIIQILIEPIDPASASNPIQLLKNCLSKRQYAVLVTLFSLYDKRAQQPGTCLLLTEEYEGGHYPADAETKALVAVDAKDALYSKTSLFKTYGTESKLTGFIEVLKPPVSLVIAGAGNDAIHVLKFALILGWEVTVVDGRASHATHERFAGAKQVLVTKAEAALQHLHPDEQTVFILMTHNYIYDITLLKQLIPLNVPYVGVLGPKKKLERMLDELQQESGSCALCQPENIYGPTGLDIGAETPEEIALSIISEIKAVLSQRAGGSLRARAEVIQPRGLQHIQPVNTRPGANESPSCSIGL